MVFVKLIIFKLTVYGSNLLLFAKFHRNRWRLLHVNKSKEQNKSIACTNLRQAGVKSSSLHVIARITVYFYAETMQDILARTKLKFNARNEQKLHASSKLKRQSRLLFNYHARILQEDYASSCVTFTSISLGNNSRICMVFVRFVS